LDAAQQGQGLMTEALRGLVRYAFDDLRLHRMQASYMPENARSARVLERLGFAVEGYAKRYLFINGQFRDHVLTALINDALPDAAQLCTPPPLGA
jgi:ribosomal-protein-alanine N-acetyltransferase